MSRLYEEAFALSRNLRRGATRARVPAGVRVLAAAVVLGGLAAAPSMAVAQLPAPLVDQVTGGKWIGAYGKCAYVLPSMKVPFQVETPILPGTNTCAQESCPTGKPPLVNPGGNYLGGASSDLQDCRGQTSPNGFIDGIKYTVRLCKSPPPAGMTTDKAQGWIWSCMYKNQSGFDPSLQFPQDAKGLASCAPLSAACSFVPQDSSGQIPADKDGSRIASTWDDAGEQIQSPADAAGLCVDMDFTGVSTAQRQLGYRLSGYFLDFDQKGRDLNIDLSIKNGPAVASVLTNFELGKYLQWKIGTLPDALTLQVNRNSATDINAVLSGLFLDRDDGSDCVAPPHLKVDKTPDAGTFSQGGAVSFAIKVTNDGSSTATNATLSDQLPTNGGLNWSGATVATTQGACAIDSSSLLSCSFGDIAAGASVTVTVALSSTPPGACTSQPNPAAIAKADGGLTAQDSGSLTCSPPDLNPPVLKVVKTPDGGSFSEGGQATFQIVVSNVAQSPGETAKNVNLTDALPGNGGLVWQTATTTQGSCTIVNNALSCALGDIPAGGSVTITVKSTASTPPAACTSQPNPAAIATASNAASAQDEGSLTCTPSKGLIAPTQVTCENYRDGTASVLGQVNYSVGNNGKIGQGINPGVFFYYTKITTTTANQVVTTSESIPVGSSAALFQILNVDPQQARIYAGDCSSWASGTVINAGTAARFTVATPGTYILSLKYQTKSIAGTNAPTPADIPYSFSTSLGGTTGASVLLKKQ